jgi:hypothetical protein
MSTSTFVTPPKSFKGRLGWRPVAVIVGVLLAVISLAGIFASAPANAAVVSLAQCNDKDAGTTGASTVMNCDIVVENTINGGLRSSVVTITRVCANDDCTGSDPTITSYPDVVTSINQCNNSGNDAAHPVNCSVTIRNFISADTPGAAPLGTVTSNQCVGSGEILCTPTPANTTGATVTQCNGSGGGGGGAVACTVPGGTVSAAIPIQVYQCNGTANKGGSVVTCSANIQTTITAAAVIPTTAPPTVTPTTTAPTTTPTAAPTSTPTGAPTAVASSGGPAGTASSGTTPLGNGSTPTSPALLGIPNTTGTTGITGTNGTPTDTLTAVPQVAVVPIGGVPTGGGSTAGLQHIGLLTVSIGLLMAAGLSTLLRRRRSALGS